jgi:leucyl-tRNA synthetase
MIDPAKEKYWMPVDLYVGGAEHAVLHLLYARFWHKVLYDLGVVHTKEPFGKLVNQGMILGEDQQKMSKSRGNVVNPDDIVDQFGADVLRIYEMFMGPLEATKPWATKDIPGVARFLDRVWRLAIRPLVAGEGGKDTQRVLHKNIKKVTEDTGAMRFNTAISALMVLTNELSKLEEVPREAVSALARMISPYAPHLGEEVWKVLGEEASVVRASWPAFDEALTVDDTVEIAIQINGKVKVRESVPQGLSKAELEALIMEHPRVKELISGKTVRKLIAVPGRLANIVVS